MKKVPELRFKEFSGEWEERQLNKIIEISNKKFNPKINLTNQICIELEHISSKTGKLLGYIDSNNQESIKNIFMENQIIYGKLRPYLRKYWFTKFNGVCSSEFWVFNGKQIDNKYLYFFVQTEKFNQISNISCGSKMPRADWNYMSLFKFYIPDAYEQKKIALFLSSIDKKIELTDKKLEFLEKYKKGLMQKLLTGKIRFPGFKDEWKEEKLGNFIKIQGGYAFKNKLFKEKGIPIIRISNLSIDGKYTNINNLVYYDKTENDNNFIIKGNDLLIAMSGATAGKVSVYNKKNIAYLNQRVGLFKLIKFDKLDYNYMTQYAFSNFFNNQLKSLLATSAQPNISSKDIEKLKIKLSSLPEQQKIASFLSAIDKKIELIKSRFENLKKYKKGLFQKMFV